MALVIGNAGYPEGALRNPVNDAEDLSASLRRLGFDVALKSNLGKRGMEQALNEFTRQLRSNDLAVFYYSGHGLQVQNENFLVPVDFRAEAEADVEYAAIPASRIRKRLEETGARVRILIFDACRNNPYRFSRDLPGGLAAMTHAAEGTIIAFSANDSEKAEDNRAGRNGLYTHYLLQALERPGLSIRDVFHSPRADVFEASGRKQLPAVHGTLIGHLVLNDRPMRRMRASTISANGNVPAEEPRMGCSPEDKECLEAKSCKPVYERPIFNPYPITWENLAGSNCTDFPVLAGRVTGSGRYFKDISAKLDDIVQLRIYMHNGAADNAKDPVMYDVRATTKIDVRTGLITTTLTAKNAASLKGSVKINLEPETRLEFVSGDPNLFVGELKPGFAESKQHSFSLKVVRR